MTQPPWQPDFSRAPDSARELWQHAVELVHGPGGKAAAALAAENLTPEEDAALARLMPEFIAVARALANAVRPGS